MESAFKRGVRKARLGASLIADALSSRTMQRHGADYMVDVFKSLGIEYLFSNPASSFGGIHESVVNYGGNRNPEFITCTHEELSVAMADGYAKIEGKPAMVCAHGTVGLQHASMAIYNAYCDQVPVYVVLGNTADAAERRGRIDWLHSAQDPAAMVRDFIKWDDHPGSLTHFADSAVRAYEIAMTPPRMPVVLVADSGLQHRRIAAGFDEKIPLVSVPAAPHGDPAAILQAARLLVDAENPVIIAGRAATSPRGLEYLVELAELLQAAVIDQHGRMNFPTRHPLNQTWCSRETLASADVILGLAVDDFFGVAHDLSGQVAVIPRPVTRTGAWFIGIGVGRLLPRSNYQNAQRHHPLDVEFVADAEATLPSLIEAVRKKLSPNRERAVVERGARLAEASRLAREQACAAAAAKWDASPVSTARLCSELWAQIKHEDWSLVSFARRVSNWPLKLWDFKRHHQYIGGAGGEGVGYVAPAAVGAALANKKHGRLSVCIQTDGDLMSSAGALWTSAHHRIPLLSVMHNNSAYHVEAVRLKRLAKRHYRLNPAAVKVGTALNDPNIDFAGMARSMGVEAEGPIVDPQKLSGAIARGIRAVKQGRPYLIDVVTQPR